MAKNKKKDEKRYKALSIDAVINECTENRVGKKKHKSSNKPLIKVRGVDGAKKKTKVLRKACVHHIRSKHGKIQTALEHGANGEMYCTLCGQHIRVAAYKDEDLERLKKDMSTFLQHAAYIFAEAPDRTSDEFGAMFINTKVMLPKIFKCYEDTTDYIRRKKKEHKKKKNGGNSSTTFNAWQTSGGHK